MKIAIHHTPNTFSDRWIEYCHLHNISFKLVNCYKSNIIDELKDCNVLLWHFSNYNYRDMLIARHILYSASAMGLYVFPNYFTSWHFDDKIAQKYLLEAINAPIINSYVFFNKLDALKWLDNTNFPIVFKLRSGSGSNNVYLINNKQRAISIINKAFSSGFSQYNRFRNLKDAYNKFLKKKITLRSFLISIWLLFFKTEYSKFHGREIGYVYFQEFLPNNDFDIRVIVICNNAFAIKRNNRDNDFRASGSGNIIYDYSQIDTRCVKIALKCHKLINSQCTAFDFLYDLNNEPKICEISFGFREKGYDSCPGYWDDNLIWHEGPFNPYGWIIEEAISMCNKTI